MKQKRTTTTALAKKLGILWRLERQFPDEAQKSCEDLEAWRNFCLSHVTEPNLIGRLAR
jgi:hypothetical protein